MVHIRRICLRRPLVHVVHVSVDAHTRTRTHARTRDASQWFDLADADEHIHPRIFGDWIYLSQFVRINPDIIEKHVHH